MLFNPTVVGASSPQSLMYVMAHEYENNSNITKVDASSSKATAAFILNKAFCSCRNLTNVSFPECAAIGGDSVFYTCSSLTTAYFPKCSYVGGYTFYNCFNLSNIEFSSSVVIGGPSAFRFCGYSVSASAGNLVSKLTAIAEQLSFIPTGTFERTKISSALTLICHTADNRAFQSCYITELSLPNCKCLGISASRVLNDGGYTFGSCVSLSTVYMPVIEQLKFGTFTGCTNLRVIYMNNVSSVPIITGNLSSSRISQVFANTGLRSYGSIYVPRSLYTAFRYASFWSAFSSRFISV